MAVVLGRGSRCSFRRSLVGLLVTTLAAASASAVKLEGTWQNTTFGSFGISKGVLEFDGAGNASFTLVLDNLFGQPGNFQLTLTGPVDPGDFSFKAAVQGHPTFGNVAVAVDPDGKVTGTLRNVPALGPGGKLDFTGQLRLDGDDLGLDLDMDFNFTGGGPIHTVHNLEILDDCTPSPTSLCLNKGRFKIFIERGDHSGNVGPGRVVPLGSPDSGLFWFFAPSNWEMLIKVLDACSFNNRFWVFYAATTDVAFTLTVIDTKTGAVKQYTNQRGKAAVPVTDTDAFATCP